MSLCVELMDVPVEQLQLCCADIENPGDGYQRTKQHARARKIAREFSEEAFEPLIVGKREDGSMWIVDGQTRWEAAKIMGMKTVACRVFLSRGIEHEAEVFAKTNKNRQAMKRIQTFFALLAMKHPPTVDTYNIVVENGFTITHYGKKWPSIRAVAKVEDAYASGILEKVLVAVRESWPTKKEALSELTIGAVAEFFRHFPNVKVDRCIKKWSQIDPNAFVGLARLQDISGGNRYRAVAGNLMNQYNKNLVDKNKLKW